MMRLLAPIVLLPVVAFPLGLPFQAQIGPPSSTAEPALQAGFVRLAPARVAPDRGTPGGGARGLDQESQADEFREARERLVREHIVDPPFGSEYAVRDAAVLGAMRTVPRHRFVPSELVRLAYEDQPLPIGHGQTISQPFIVATMTEILRVGPEDRVLEIGTGSGYQAAVLAEIVDRVFTIEIVEPLAVSAADRLEDLGYANVAVRHGDGYFGWEAEAPFDGVIVTAAASHIPPPLIEQLRPGARMVIPVGPPFQVQTLMLLEKQADGTVVQRSLMPVRFVPLTRAE